MGIPVPRRSGYSAHHKHRKHRRKARFPLQLHGEISPSESHHDGDSLLQRMPVRRQWRMLPMSGRICTHGLLSDKIAQPFAIAD